MAKLNPISERETEAHAQALNIILEIVGAAHAADRMCTLLPAEGEHEAHELHCDALREIICKMGWLAESALVRFGDTDRLARDGKAENWLMSPVCRTEEVQP